MDKEPINLNIVEGKPFFAHEMSINFTPTQMSFDFKCITPRTDPRSKKPSFQLEHNVVMVEPWHAKMIYQVLGNVIKKYEEEYGAIKKPKSLEKAEKKQKTAVKEVTAGDETPSYLG